MCLGAPWCPFDQHLLTHLQTWRTLGTHLNPINVLMTTGGITKTGTLATTFHKLLVEANPYVRFGYIPLEICNHTQGQVSGSINADPMNMIHTNQKPTNEGLNK